MKVLLLLWRPIRSSQHGRSAPDFYEQLFGAADRSGAWRESGSANHCWPSGIALIMSPLATSCEKLFPNRRVAAIGISLGAASITLSQTATRTSMPSYSKSMYPTVSEAVEDRLRLRQD